MGKLIDGDRGGAQRDATGRFGPKQGGEEKSKHEVDK